MVKQLSLSNPLLGLISGQVFLHASTAGLRMAIPLLVLESSGAASLVGPCVALFALAPLVLALPAGRLADRRGYHVPVQLAVLLSCAGGVCAVLSTIWAQLQYPLLCLAALASGAGCNIGLTTIQRSAGRRATDVTQLKRTFSWLGIAPSLSNFVGPAIAGPLIDHVGMRATFVALTVLPLFTLLVGRWVPRESLVSLSAAERAPAWNLLSGTMLRRLLLVSCFMSTSWDVHSIAVPVLGHERGFSASAIASVLGAFALAITATRLVLPSLAHRMSEAQTLRYSLLVVAAVFAIYPLATSVYSMAACAACLGFALGTSQPMVLTALHQITPAARHGEAIALRSMVSSASSASTPLMFASASAVLGVGSLFWVVAGLSSFATLALRGIDLNALPQHTPVRTTSSQTTGRCG